MQQRMCSNPARLPHKAWLAQKLNNLDVMMGVMHSKVCSCRWKGKPWQTLGTSVCLVRSGACAWHCLQPCSVTHHR